MKALLSAALTLIAVLSPAQELSKLWTIATPARMRQIAVCGESGTMVGLARKGAVFAWRLPAGELIASRPPEPGITAIACSNDGHSIAIAHRDGSIILTDASFQPLHTLHSSAASVPLLIFAPDSALLAAASFNEPATLWNASSGQVVARLHTNFSDSGDIAFSPDSSTIATADSDTTIRLYDRSGKLMSEFAQLLLEPTAVYFTPDGKQLMVADGGGSINLLDAHDAHLLRTLAKQPDGAFQAAALADGRSLISLQLDPLTMGKPRLLLWDLTSGAPRELKLPPAPVIGFHTGPQHRLMLITPMSDTTIAAWVLP